MSVSVSVYVHGYFPSPPVLFTHLSGDMWDFWMGYLSKWKVTNLLNMYIIFYYPFLLFHISLLAPYLIMHLCSVYMFCASVHFMCDIVCPYTHCANL